jgi:cobalt/nickel transport system ATP-binding protein
MLEIIDLHYTYPDGTPALQGVSLHIAAGERVAIIGPNGAGKSTLLLHTNGILQGQGSIKINGLAISKSNLPRIRALVGMVFQNPDDQLFSLSVGEDVGYGPSFQGLNKAIVAQKIDYALKAVRMEGYALRHPFHLSGGEKKRVSIATVLSMDPDILVLDEPTSGLDPKSRRELIALLVSLPQAQLIATHDLALVRDLATRVVLINHGRVVADCPVESMLADQTLLADNDLV